MGPAGRQEATRGQCSTNGQPGIVGCSSGSLRGSWKPWRSCGRKEASKRGWWSTARLPEWLANYVGLETEASSVRSFELELIPGLLQTEAYAREIHILRGQKPDDLERRVTARLRRQERLTDSDPVQLSALISEAALARCARQPTVAAEQFRQLLDWATLPNVEIQVLPSGAGLHSGMSGAFTLISFPEGLLPDAGWQEYALGGHIIDDPADVASLTTLYEELRSQALGLLMSTTAAWSVFTVR